VATAARPVARRSREAARSALAGFALSLLFAAGWVLLTNRTGATYHFFPLILAATPATLGRRASDVRLDLRSAFLAAGGGLLAVAIGWAASWRSMPCRPPRSLKASSAASAARRLPSRSSASPSGHGGAAALSASVDLAGIEVA